MSDLEPTDVELWRAARERALEILYEAEIKGVEVDDLLAGLPLSPADLTLELVRGVEAHRSALDGLLEHRVAPSWSLIRLAAVDRAILRLGAYELAHVPQRSVAVILNEAVVLARRFGTDDSPRFVNGVLSAVAADVRSVPVPGDEAARELEPQARRDEEEREAGVLAEVDALVMDMDGVIRHWDEASVSAGDAALGVPEGTIAAAAFEPDLLDRCMRGEITAVEWYAEAGAAVARRHPAEAEAAAEVMAGVGWTIDEMVMELVDQVRRRVPVALLSNASSRLQEDLRVSGIHDRFDAVVSSADLGVVKPDPAAYEAAAKALGVGPDRCMMVDDREENVAGAAAVGMRAVRFTDVEALARDLEAAGLLDPVDDGAAGLDAATNTATDVDRDPAS